MNLFNRGSYKLTLPIMFLIFTTIVSRGDVPPRSNGGQTLVIPEKHLDLGEIYHVTPDLGTQLVWNSDAPLLRLMATCNRVVGYFVTPFDLEEGQSPLLTGAIRVPVASLSTGYERFDAEIHGPAMFDAAKYPEITFIITRVSEAKLISNENERRNYTLTLAGEFTLKDKTIELEMPASLTLLPFTWHTMQFSVGDLLILRAQIDIKAADVGLQPPNPAGNDFSAEVVKLDLFLLCSTVSPEKNLDPTIKHEHFRKQQQFLTLVRDFNDPRKGYEYGRAFMREIWDDAPALNRLAWATLTEEGIETRDLLFAAKAAQRANELSESKDPRCLNTLARVYYDKADLESALEWSRKAVENLEGVPPYVAAEIRAALQRYEARAKMNQD